VRKKKRQLVLVFTAVRRHILEVVANIEKLWSPLLANVNLTKATLVSDSTNSTAFNAL